MDYEKKYKKALDNASVIHKCGNGDVKHIIEQLFPELMESEDERIRKALIHLVNSNKELSFGIDNYDDIKWSDILAWLERQNPAEWSEEDSLMLDETLFFIQEFQKSDRCKNENDMQNSVTCENWLKSLKDRVLPKLAEWSEEDKKHYNMCLQYFATIKEDSIFYEDYLWLKSLRPQNRWKPSELQLDCLSDAIKYYNSLGYPASKLKELLDDLKKLMEE